MHKLYLDDVEHLLGLPWERAASGPDSYDCWGLVKSCLDMMGIDYSVSVDYSFPNGIEKEFESSLDSWEKLRKPEFNCIVYGFIGDIPYHIGFVIGGHVLHSIGDSINPGYVVLTKIPNFKRMYSKVEFFKWRR